MADHKYLHLGGNKMRILYLVPDFFPEYSGATTRLYNILSKLPFEILLITSNTTVKGNIIELKEEHFDNVRVKRVSMHSKNIFLGIPLLRYIDTIYQKPKILINAAKSDQFDIIHARNSSLFVRATEQLSRKLDKPFIIEVNAMGEDYLSIVKRNSAKGKINALYMERTAKSQLKSCNCIIAISQGVKNYIVNRYKVQEDKITVVPNGVDVNNFSPTNEYKKEAEKIKEKLNISSKVIMYAGYMDRINGMIDLAKVIPSIITKKPDISFLFIGHGPEEDKIIALSKKYPQVKFLPMVHYDEMPIYYQMCDLFIIPRPSTISAETVTPLKLLEVMAMEKPVLGSDVGGIAEVIRHGENGYLYEKGNMESFKKTLLEVLNMGNTQIGRNARKKVVENYTWDKSAKILQKVYEDLV